MNRKRLGLVLPHQSEVQTEPRRGGERDCCRVWTPGTSTTRLVVGVISAIVEKEWGERNVGFDSLKSTLNRNMDEKGIVARIVSRRGSSAGAPPPGPLQRSTGGYHIT
ncbi:unnamed protein product [Boreogadus saida]